MNNLISVIVPIFNSRKYIERCITSICSQTYENLEIILVDDGSSDGSGELCDEFCRRDPRVIVIHKANGGSTSARNEGLACAKGKYVGFVDSDDWIEPDMFELLVNGCIDNNANICIGRQYLNQGETYHVEAERSIVEGVLEKHSHEIVHHIIYSDDYKNRGISPNLWDKLFDADLIRKHQSMVDEKTKFAEDDLCVYSALLDADRVALIDKPIYHYCRRTDSVTSKADRDYFSKITLFYNQMSVVFEKHSESELLMKKLNRYMIEFLLRGINKNFGFGFGNVVPFFLPPYKKLQECNAHSIVLYGAGEVGKDYYNGLKQSGYNIVAWADMRGAYLSTLGFETVAPEKIKDVEYDVIVIASDSEDLMNQMLTMLVQEIGVDSSRIIAEYPIKFVESLMENSLR